jgi:hypothetical protein
MSISRIKFFYIYLYLPIIYLLFDIIEWVTYSVGLFFLTFTPFHCCALQIFPDVTLREVPSRSNGRWVPRLTLPCHFNTVPLTLQFLLCFSLSSLPISFIYVLLSYFVSLISGAWIFSPAISTNDIYFPFVLLYIICGVCSEIDNYPLLVCIWVLYL